MLKIFATLQVLEVPPATGAATMVKIILYNRAKNL